MKPAWRLLALVTVVGACEGRELAVFDIAAGLAGSSGAASGGTGTGGANAEGGGVGATGGSSTSGELGGGGSVTSSAGSAVIAGGGAGGAPVSGGEGGDTSAAGAGSGLCAGDGDCDGGWLCEKPGCHEPFGQCVPWPVFCSRDPEPVCGCDGVTYWNDCVRLSSRSHPPLAGPGQCRETARRCDQGTDCGVPYSSCSHLMAPGKLCRPVKGSCWLLPPRCAPSNDEKVWRECRPPEQEPPPFCVDTCLAIRSERPHAELDDANTCN